MASPKTKVVDTAATNPSAFLAGAEVPSPAPIPPTPTPPEPSTPAPETDKPEPAPEPTSVPATPELAPTPDPFTLLMKWEGANTKRTLRALSVPGGCIVRVSAAIPGNLSESICFVPGVKIQDGQLVAA